MVKDSMDGANPEKVGGIRAEVATLVILAVSKIESRDGEQSFAMTWALLSQRSRRLSLERQFWWRVDCASGTRHEFVGLGVGI